MRGSVSQDDEFGPDPEEIPADAQSFPGGILILAMLGYVFATVLPYWRPLAWWLLVVSTGLIRIFVIRRLGATEISHSTRRWVLRAMIWMFMASISSSAYFLYVPNNAAMQTLLIVYLLGTATFLLAHLTGLDRLRIMVALLILGTPTALRLILEGVYNGQIATWAVGCCALFVPIPLAQISNVQMRLMRNQFMARVEAENEAKTLSAVAIEKARFFSAISHDLRQPVHAIGLYLDAIDRNVLESADLRTRHALGGISLSWQTLNELLTKVLELARFDAGTITPELAPLSLAALIRNLVREHYPIGERNGVRIVALVRIDYIVYSDEFMLKRVLSNLLGNAIKYSPPGQSVVIAVRYAVGGVRVQVRDAGCGIAEEDQAHIFSEFTQVGRAAHGSSTSFGLGLAIAKRLIESLGGEISVRSKLGEGCCMTIKMPSYGCDPTAGLIQGTNVAQIELNNIGV